MSYHHRPHELRLAISSEVDALISDFGDQAYAEACRRAEEASNDSLARDRGDDRPQLGQALIRARRLIRLNRRTLIRRQRRGVGSATRRARGRLSGRLFCLPVVDSVLARSHLIQSQGYERPAVRRHYSFGSALNGVAANPRKLAATSPRRASCSKWAGGGGGLRAARLR
jgi:hypothetical protein